MLGLLELTVQWGRQELIKTNECTVMRGYILPIKEKFMGIWEYIIVKPELVFGVGNWKGFPGSPEKVTFDFVFQIDRSKSR